MMRRPATSRPTSIHLFCGAGGDSDGFRRAGFDVVLGANHWARAVETHAANFPEAAWPLFDWWTYGMDILGLEHQIVSVSAAHVGAEDNEHAPQWRDRIFIVFTRKGMRRPDLTLRPPAWCTVCEEDVQAVQSWRNGRRIGRYRQQYDYRCPNSRCRRQIVEPYVRPAASAIDWSDLGIRIGDRPALKMRPLAASTPRKIGMGLEKHRVPSIVTVNHSAPGDGRAVPAASWPLATRTVRIGDGIAVPPLVHGPFITELRGGGSSTRAISDPLATITAGGNHHGLVVPYRRGAAKTTGEPLHTVATRESAGLILGADSAPAEIALEDCYYRMLSPREHLRAQRFTDDYTVLGNGGEQTMQAGNAVPANVAQWIASRLLEVL